MLAYTNFTDLFYSPTPLEAAVYLTGFLMVLTVPTLLFKLSDQLAARKSQMTARRNEKSTS